MEEAIQTCEIMEISKQRSEDINKQPTPTEVDILSKNQNKYVKLCNNCGGTHPINKCAAYGK